MAEFPNKATQWQKGSSGNPGGRPRGRSLRSHLLYVGEEEAKLRGKHDGHGLSRAELLIREMWDEAIRTKDVGLLRLIFAYHDGKPPKAAPDGPDDPADAKPRIIIPDADDRHTKT